MYDNNELESNQEDIKAAEAGGCRRAVGKSSRFFVSGRGRTHLGFYDVMVKMLLKGQRRRFVLFWCTSPNVLPDLGQDTRFLFYLVLKEEKRN